MWLLIWIHLASPPANYQSTVVGAFSVVKHCMTIGNIARTQLPPTETILCVKTEVPKYEELSNDLSASK